MKNKDHATRTKGSRSITQEMHQAFADWVDKLPFIKKATPKASEWEDLEDDSADRPSRGKER